MPLPDVLLPVLAIECFFYRGRQGVIYELYPEACCAAVAGLPVDICGPGPLALAHLALSCSFGVKQV